MPSTGLPHPAPAPSLSITGRIPESTLANLVTLLIFEFIAFLCILLRIYTRIFGNGLFFLNDCAILWAFFWASAIAFVSIAADLQGAMGFHITEIIELAPERLVLLGKV